MGTCDTCGNHYDKAFDVILGGTKHTFDCFECAINYLAPECAQCSCKVIGHGVEVNDVVFCCKHCAERVGVTDLRDRSHQSL